MFSLNSMYQDKKEEIRYENKVFRGTAKYNKYYFEKAPAPIEIYTEYFEKQLKQQKLLLIQKRYDLSLLEEINE